MNRRHKMPYLVGILFLLILALAWVGNYSVNRVANLTEDFYEYPFVVSTAVLRINTNIIIMHRAMKDIVLSDSQAATDRYRNIVDKMEEQVLTDFKLVEERFLGDSEMVKAARRSFLAWKPIREEVIRLVLEGKRPEAAVITQTTGARQVEEIETKIGELRDYARNKAREFLMTAQETRARTLWFIWFSLGGSIILAGFVIYKTVRLEAHLQEFNDQLNLKVRQRTAELATANESLSAQYEEITAMNEEIESLNQNLTGMNDVLERRVADRTSDLTAAHQEVSAQYAELRQMEEQLHKLNETLEKQVGKRTLELEATNKELEGFNYSVAHDLRAPLRHISGFIEILSIDAADQLDATSRDYLQRILDASTKMGQLIDHLMAFSQMGKEEMVQHGVDSGKLIREVMDTLKPEMQGRNIEWIVGELPAVTGDSSMLKIVWSNLLSNALKYTRPKAQAKIEIGATPDPQDSASIIFFVKDNGVGFDMKYKDKLFGLFQRLHSQSEFAGHGVGLANVQRIIVRHGGRVWAEGQVNEGATFYFTLHKGPTVENFLGIIGIGEYLGGVMNGGRNHPVGGRQ